MYYVRSARLSLPSTQRWNTARVERIADHRIRRGANDADRRRIGVILPPSDASVFLAVAYRNPRARHVFDAVRTCGRSSRRPHDCGGIHIAERRRVFPAGTTMGRFFWRRQASKNSSGQLYTFRICRSGEPVEKFVRE